MRGQVRHLLAVYAALLALLALTTGSALVNLGALNTPLNIAISVAKTLLILWFFMELRGASGLIRLAAVMGFYWLMILLTLGMADWVTR